MQQYSNTFQNSLGRPVKQTDNAQIAVYTYPGNVLAVLYSDNGVTPKGNPVTTDENGLFEFYAADGRYTLVLTSDTTEDVTLTDAVLLEDPADNTAAQISFIAAGAGAVTRTAQDKMRESVTPQDFMTAEQRADVEAGDLTIGVWDAFAAAIATGRPVYVPTGPGWAYLLDAAVSIPSNTTLYSHGATLFLEGGVDNHVLRIADGSYNVEIRGFLINGNKAGNAFGSGIGSGSSALDNIRVTDNIIVDCFDHGIYVNQAQNVKVHGNFVTGCGDGGITTDGTVTYFSLMNNHCWNNGTHGVGILGIGKHGVIGNNVCWDNGQAVPSADNLTGYNSANENISIDGNISQGGLNNGIHFGGSHISYTGNEVYDAINNGLFHSPHTGVQTDVTITGNTVVSCGLQGIRVRNTSVCAISGNTTIFNTTAGMGLDDCSDVSITGNIIRSNTTEGIVFGGTNTRLNISSNEVTSNGSVGLAIANVTFANIIGNIINSNSGAAILGGGTEGNNTIACNILRSNVGGASLLFANNTKVYGNDTNMGPAFHVSTPSDQQAFAIHNTSLASNRFWSWRPVTNGTDTDVYIRENGGTPADRGRYVAGGRQEWFGDFALTVAGKGLSVKEGSNAKQGVATLVAGTVTVNNTSVTANSRILLSAQDNSTTGALRISARSPGTSFTITSSNAGDTGVIAYEIFEPS